MNYLNSLVTNWKTTVSGLLSIALVVAGMVGVSPDPNLTNALGTALAGLSGILAHDAGNVTTAPVPTAQPTQGTN